MSKKKGKKGKKEKRKISKVNDQTSAPERHESKFETYQISMEENGGWILNTLNGMRCTYACRHCTSSSLRAVITRARPRVTHAALVLSIIITIIIIINAAVLAPAKSAAGGTGGKAKTLPLEAPSSSGCRISPGEEIYRKRKGK